MFFLCTDGCWEGVEEHEMEDMLNASQSGEDWLHRIDARITAIAKKVRIITLRFLSGVETLIKHKCM